MRVVVRLFASARDWVGVDRLEIGLPDAATIEDAKDVLRAARPELSAHLSRCAFALNREYVREDQTLQNGDELAVLPPVSGG